MSFCFSHVQPPENFQQWARGGAPSHNHQEQAGRIAKSVMKYFGVTSAAHCHMIGSIHHGTANRKTFDVDLLLFVDGLDMEAAVNDPNVTVKLPRRAYDKHHFQCFKMEFDGRSVDVMITNHKNVYEREKEYQKATAKRFSKRPDAEELRLLVRVLKSVRPDNCTVPSSHMLSLVARFTHHFSSNPPLPKNAAKAEKRCAKNWMNTHSVDDFVVPVASRTNRVERAFYLSVIALAFPSRLKKCFHKSIIERYPVDEVDHEYWLALAKHMQSQGYDTFAGVPGYRQ